MSSFYAKTGPVDDCFYLIYHKSKLCFSHVSIDQLVAKIFLKTKFEQPERKDPDLPLYFG